jgi:hypothetical protein
VHCGITWMKEKKECFHVNWKRLVVCTAEEAIDSKWLIGSPTYTILIVFYPCHRGSRRPLRFFPPPLLAALLRVGRCIARRFPSPMSRSELSDQAKRSASSPRPTCTKSMPAEPASEAGPRDFPAIIFLRERLTGGSPLQLFPHPAASSAPPRCSSPTTSSATSTTPLASQWRLLPVGTRAAAEAPPPGEHPLPDLPS